MKSGSRTRPGPVRRTVRCVYGRNADLGRVSRLTSDTGVLNLFGAICPVRGAGAALILMMPWADTHAMQQQGEISRHVKRGAHAVVLMDRAGRHTTDKPKVPGNITILLLPSRSPDLNPVENIRQYMRQNWLSNRVFETYDAILDAGCDAWRRLIRKPGVIKSIGMRKWHHNDQS